MPTITNKKFGINMEVTLKNLEKIIKPDENLTKLSKIDKYNLKSLVMERISVIKKCKKNLYIKTRILINKIENLLSSSLKEMDNFIISWLKLIKKEKYNTEELLRIKKINSIKLIASPVNQFFDLDEIIKSYLEKPFICKPIYKDNFEVKWNQFKKFNVAKITRVLRSQDGSFYVTGGTDGVVRIWDKKGNMKDSYYYEQAEISALTLSADRQYLVFGSKDGYVVIINLKSPDDAHGIFRCNEKIKSVSISAYSQYVISGTFDAIVLLDILSLNFKVLNNFNGSMCFFRQIGNLEYFLGSQDEKIFIFKCGLSSGCIKTLKNIDMDKCPVFSKCGKYAVVSQSDYDSENKILVFKLNLSANESYLNKDKEVVGVKVRKSNALKKLKIEHKRIVEEVFITENFKFIVFLSARNICVWSTYDKRILYSRTLGIFQKILGLSHGIVFIEIDQHSVLSWDLTKNKIKDITNMCKTKETKLSASVSKDLLFILIAARNKVKVISKQSEMKILSIFSEKSNYIYTLIDKMHNIFIISNSSLKLYESYNKTILFEIKFGCYFQHPLGFLSGDETHIIILSKNEDLSVLINLEKRTIVGIFDRLKGINSMYINSFKNTEFIHFKMLAIKNNPKDKQERYN